MIFATVDTRHWALHLRFISYVRAGYVSGWPWLFWLTFFYPGVYVSTQNYPISKWCFLDGLAFCSSLFDPTRILILKVKTLKYRVDWFKEKLLITESIVSSTVLDRSRGRPEGSPFFLATTPRCRGVTTLPGFLHFTLDPNLIMLRVKQNGIKYHILSLWYDSIWDWTPVSRAIGKHSTNLDNVQVLLNTVIFSEANYNNLSNALSCEVTKVIYRKIF